jgi:hypothetical protein
VYLGAVIQLTLANVIEMAIKKSKNGHDYYFITRMLMEVTFPQKLFGNVNQFIYKVLNEEFRARYSLDNSCWQFIKIDTEYPLHSDLYETKYIQPSGHQFLKWIKSSMDVYVADEYDNLFVNNLEGENNVLNSNDTIKVNCNNNTIVITLRT